MLKNSYAWNCDPFPGLVMVGVPAGAGPSPVIEKVPTADHAESRKPVAPPTFCVAFTLQKYEPFGRPLTLACVGTGSPLRVSVKPDAITTLNADVVPTCHV